ncbi:hypothetical protein [Amaricoccus solimangrovi]|uniref:Uncharacterized protein n=1 Tax=Amaricoccus solimangrovi TaxID=2589815 RepID=A0A501WW03_9RHOB|nr:hypothetical protein [Amaricoccus solimangrovi]TPE52610.1 hypothetical protein FJM51_05375 [Amaricoccus solimangrovi]
MNGPLEQSISIETSALFLARRNTTDLRAGDRVIVQTHDAGQQIEALVMGAHPAEVLVRFSRWSQTFAIPPVAVLRMLPRDLAA